MYPGISISGNVIGVPEEILGSEVIKGHDFISLSFVIIMRNTSYTDLHNSLFPIAVIILMNVEFLKRPKAIWSVSMLDIIHLQIMID